MNSTRNRRRGNGGKIGTRSICRLTIAVLVLLYWYAFTKLGEESRGVRNRADHVSVSLSNSKRAVLDQTSAFSSRRELDHPSKVHIMGSTAKTRQKLQDKLDHAYKSNGRAFSGDLWELSDFAPPWMKGELQFCSIVREKWKVAVTSSSSRRILHRILYLAQGRAQETDRIELGIA